MGFYIFRALFPALLIDIFLTSYFLNQGKNKLAAFTTVLFYFINSFIWSLVLGRTNSAFSGQGAIGLALLVSFGIAFSILRLLLGTAFFLQTKQK